MTYKVINNNGGISGVFKKRKDAFSYSKLKGLKYQWFIPFEPLDELITIFKKFFLK